MDTAKTGLKQVNHTQIVRWVIALLTLFVYVSFFVADGVVMGVDTPGYINKALSREMGYALWIQLFRMIFGEAGYAVAVVICQFSISAAVTCIFTFAIADIYKVKPFSEFVIWGVQIFFLMLCRFGSGLQAIYPSTVLTEGLTYSLYFLFVKAILQLNRQYSAKRAIEVTVYCVLMMLIRTQLAVGFMGVMAFFFFKAFFKQFPWKKWFFLVGLSVTGMAAVLLCGKLYTKAVHGVFTGTVGSSSFTIVSGLYGADEEDENLFETEEERRIFVELYDRCMEQGLNYKNAPAEGMFAAVNYYCNQFDLIKFGTVMPYFSEYLIEQGITDPVQNEIAIDEWSRKLGVPLLKDNIGIKLQVFAQDIFRSLMRTIGKASALLVVPIAIVYLAYLGLMTLGFWRKEKGNTAWGALFVLIMMLGNIAATCFMIFGEPRYLLYNMVPFYTMGYLMLREAWVARKEKKHDSSTLLNHME